MVGALAEKLRRVATKEEIIAGLNMRGILSWGS